MSGLLGPSFLASSVPRGPPELPFWPPWASEAAQEDILDLQSVQTMTKKALKHRPEGLAPTKILSRTRTPTVLPKTSSSRKGAAVARQRFQLRKIRKLYVNTIDTRIERTDRIEFAHRAYRVDRRKLNS